MQRVLSTPVDEDLWFSNLFKCATISMNISSKGPITLSTTPADVFQRNILENLGLRALLSAGIGEHDYQDRIFSARITIPKLEIGTYEALLFNFVVIEDSEQITLKMNSKALTLLILIYPRKFRKFINRFEEDFELLLAGSDILPSKATDLLDEEKLNAFIETLRKLIIMFENETLLNYKEFTIHTLYDENDMKIESNTYISDFK